MLSTLSWLITKAFSWRCCKYGCHVRQHQHGIRKWALTCTSRGKVAAKVPEVRELHARCLIASGTSHSGVAVMEVVVLGPFGNFQFGFWLESFGAQVFWCWQFGMECGSFGVSFSYPCSHLQYGWPFFLLKPLFSAGAEILPLLTPFFMRSHTTTVLVNYWAELPITCL